MISALKEEKLSKNDLRKFALKKRGQLAYSAQNPIKSNNIISLILNSSDFKKAKNVALYYPIKNEIDIMAITKAKEKNFYLPKCQDNELFFVKYQGIKNLQKGAYSIPECTGQIINPNILDIIYIPALMANKRNYRLGYGKGFYDRFFKKYDLKAKKIIIIAKELVDENFIEDTFDYRCDGIICA